MADISVKSSGVFSHKARWDAYLPYQNTYYKFKDEDYNFKYKLNGMPTSSNETRPKTKFFSLMIYAGYPMQ